MGFASEVKRILAGSNGRPFRFDSLSFDPPDVDRAAARLKLADLGKRNGIDDLPQTNDTQPDGPHEKIYQYVEREIASTKAESEVALMGLDEHLAALDTDAIVKTLRRVPTELRNALEDNRRSLEFQLARAREQLESAREEYQRFRRERGIRRAPRYPEEKMNLLLFVFAIFVVEAITNAWFFATGSELGMVGGTVIAAGFALVDVAVSFNLGRLAKKVLAPAAGHRLLGGTMAAVFAVWAVVYNLVVAHVREERYTEIQQATVQGLQSFRESPLGLEDTTSWVLVVLGLLYSIFAMIDGARYDDAWFGYEDHHRKLLMAEEEYEYSKSALFEQARQLRDEAARNCDLLATKVADVVVNLSNGIERKKTLQRNYEHFMRASEQVCRTLISTYRDENRRHRSTPPPPYFDEPFAVRWQVFSPREVELDESHLAIQRRNREEAPTIREDMLDQVDRVYDAYCASLQVIVDGGRPARDRPPTPDAIPETEARA
ncbi:MAG TPA: hypothetical protein VKA86_06700 [Candidatus Krumholzibacteria bacterium]|nr:hypothetical protein [Candidatus Krumholzibacteria bacterium]